MTWLILAATEKTGFLHFCISVNKDADQLCGDREADQRLCFRYLDRTFLLLFKSKISSVAIKPSLCRTWSDILKTGFLTMRLICESQPGIALDKINNDNNLYIQGG